ncbi:MAG: DUF1963 domain-containing protein [Janthinobacterium lividum]
MNPSQTYDIIEFTAQPGQYYGDSIKMSKLVLQSGNYVKASAKNIPLGHSRYGGPVADLPPGVAYPPELRLAAQLDLAVFAPHDKTGLLPKTGQLLFFAHPRDDRGQVLYADVPNDELVRVVRDHEDNFYSGVLIDQVFAATETLASRYRAPEDEEEAEWAKEAGSLNADGLLWDDFAGSKQSKIFGIYTHCQLGEEEIIDILNSSKVLLLQVGENGFNDEGVFSVLIEEADLAACDFTRCEFAWGQS